MGDALSSSEMTPLVVVGVAAKEQLTHGRRTSLHADGTSSQSALIAHPATPPRLNTLPQSWVSHSRLCCPMPL